MASSISSHHSNIVSKMKCHSTFDGGYSISLLLSGLEYYTETSSITILFHIIHKKATVFIVYLC